METGREKGKCLKLSISGGENVRGGTVRGKCPGTNMSREKYPKPK